MNKVRSEQNTHKHQNMAFLGFVFNMLPFSHNHEQNHKIEKTSPQWTPKHNYFNIHFRLICLKFSHELCDF